MTGPFPLAFLLAMAAHGRPPAVAPPEPVAVEAEGDEPDPYWDTFRPESETWVKVDCFMQRPVPPPRGRP